MLLIIGADEGGGVMNITIFTYVDPIERLPPMGWRRERVWC